MYDVLYLDQGTMRLVAASLERHSAIIVARAEADARGIGRMFLAGSDPPPAGRAVLIVDSSGGATVAAVA
ncbi:MAG TPA: hypothetical protein VHJ54_01900 [Solirubrobacterales bacterium]|jgi:hypothetical protein|nr:hypothetical protein [Solirubrobacterales bacterium]